MRLRDYSSFFQPEELEALVAAHRSRLARSLDEKA